MPYCPNCGAEVTGAYCASCGSPASSEAPAGAGTGPAQPLTDNVAAALCYIFFVFTGFLFLAWAPYNRSKNVRFHAIQSILFTAAWLFIHFMVGLIMPWSLVVPVGEAIHIGFLLLWIFLMWKTYNGERIVLPFIGELAEKQT